MADPLTAALVVGGATSALGFSEAQSRNKSLERNAGRQKAMNAVQANEQRDKLARDFAQFAGSLRTTSAGRGIAGSATANAMDLGAFSGGLRERTNIATNEYFGNVSADNYRDANSSNVFLTGLSSGISGFMAGYSTGGFGSKKPPTTGGYP